MSEQNAFAEGPPGPIIPVGSTAIVAMGDDFEVPVTRAPWSPEQVASLKAYQAAGGFHPFTCGNDDCPCADEDGEPDHAVLVPHADGWQCPVCNYTQDWAHAFIADGSWRDWAGIEVRVDDGGPVRGSIGHIPDAVFRTALGEQEPSGGPPYTHVLRQPEAEEGQEPGFWPSMTVERGNVDG